MRHRETAEHIPVGKALVPQPESEQTLPSTDTLFRPEALAARAGPAYGTIKLSQPLSSKLIVLAATAIAAALIGFIALGSYDRKAKVGGITMPVGGIVTISATVTGVLSKQLVAEGQAVKAGQPLFELSTGRLVAGGEVSAQAAQQWTLRKHSIDAERRARTEALEQQRRSIKSRLQNLAAQAAQLDKELELADRRLRLAEQTLANFEALHASKFVSTAQTQQKQEDVLEMEARRSALMRSRGQLQTERADLQFEYKHAEAQFAMAMSQLDGAAAVVALNQAENDALAMRIIVAPHDGTVTSITNAVGQHVLNGQVLATLIPASSAHAGGKMEVHLFAPSRTIGLVAPGQPVLIRLEAFPYQKFGMHEGVIEHVGTTPLAPADLQASIAGTVLGQAQHHHGAHPGEGLYRIRVRLNEQVVTAFGRPLPLKPGMTVEAEIQQERRSVWEWIVEPLLSLGPHAGHSH